MRSISVRQESYWQPASLSPGRQLCGKLPPGSSPVELLPSSYPLLTPEDFSKFAKVFGYLWEVFLRSLQKYYGDLWEEFLLPAPLKWSCPDNRSACHKCDYTFLCEAPLKKHILSLDPEHLAFTEEVIHDKVVINHWCHQLSNYLTWKSEDLQGVFFSLGLPLKS